MYDRGNSQKKNYNVPQGEISPVVGETNYIFIKLTLDSSWFYLKYINYNARNDDNTLVNVLLK